MQRGGFKDDHFGTCQPTLQPARLFGAHRFKISYQAYIRACLPHRSVLYPAWTHIGCMETRHILDSDVHDISVVRTMFLCQRWTVMKPGSQHWPVNDTSALTRMRRSLKALVMWHWEMWNLRIRRNLRIPRRGHHAVCRIRECLGFIHICNTSRFLKTTHFCPRKLSGKFENLKMV